MYMIIYFIILYLFTCCNSLNKVIVTKPGSLKGFYMLGITKYIKDNYDLKNTIFYGASAGSWNSLFYVLNNSDELFLKEIENIDVFDFKSMLDIEYKMKYNILNRFEKKDFDLKRLNICVSVFEDYKVKKMIYNKFYNLNDAINCCIASSHIPYITTRTATYSYRDKSCFDGGFFNSPYSEGVIPNLVVYPEMWNNTNIDDYSRLKNLNIKKLIYAGYEDTHKNRLFIEESLKINKCDESD